MRMRHGHIMWPMHRGQIFSDIVEIRDPICHSLYNFYGSTIKTSWVICQNRVWPCDKDHSAHAQTDMSLVEDRKSVTTIVLGNHDFLLRASTFSDLAAFRAIFSHIFNAHAQKRLFLSFLCISDIDIWLFDPDFLIGNNISTIWRRFMLIFALDKLNVCHISTSGLVDLQTYKASCVSPLTIKIFTKFEVDTTICCLVIAFLLLTRYMILWPWPLTFGPWSLSVHGKSWSTPPPRLKVLHLSVLEFLSSDISRRIPLIMRLQPLRMRCITWPIPRGKFFIHIWNPDPRFACSLYNFYGATMTSKGCLQRACLVKVKLHLPIAEGAVVDYSAEWHDGDLTRHSMDLQNVWSDRIKRPLVTSVTFCWSARSQLQAAQQSASSVSCRSEQWRGQDLWSGVPLPTWPTDKSRLNLTFCWFPIFLPTKTTLVLSGLSTMSRTLSSVQHIGWFHA